MMKFEVFAALARRRGLTSFLEISTATTGAIFGKVDRAQFTTVHRLAYNMPEALHDGLEYTYRTTAPSSHELISAILNAPGARPLYDVVFVDPFHTYRCSITDLYGAWRVTRPGGIIVVHDCNPESPDLVAPEFHEGPWCGVTYQAFIDFTLAKPTLHFYTVDTDFGCGVMVKPPCSEPPTRDVRRLEELQHEWSVARDKPESRYGYFDRNRAELLNLISVAAFRAAECDAPSQSDAPAHASWGQRSPSSL
jgi:hypothetical protein